jgi:hypothetical protein
LIKLCYYCNKEFELEYNSSKYCSIGCRKSTRNILRQTYNKDYRDKFPKDLKGRPPVLPYQKYITKFISKIKQYTIDTDITKEFLESMFKGADHSCMITKIPFEYTNFYGGLKNPYAPSLDQINPGKGYYKDNVQLVSNFINRAKNDMTNESLLVLLNKIIEGGPVGGNLVYPIFKEKSTM